MLTSWGANCLALSGADATLLVDPLTAPAHARLVESELARRGVPPVRHVVLTHHHTDHALGAGHLARRGVEVVCHRACAREMAAQHAGLVADRRRAPHHAALFADAEEADVAALPRRLEALAPLPVLRFVPGHGVPGGRALPDEQASYQAEVARLCAGASDDAEARAAILGRFPGHALTMAVDSAIAAHRAPRRR